MARRDLIGATGAAELLGLTASEFAYLERARPLPSSAAMLGNRRVWLSSDLEAFRDGKPFPEREPEELDGEVINREELAALLSRSPRTLGRSIGTARWDLVPEPAGRIGPIPYWWREDVEQWLEKKTSDRREDHEGNNDR